MPRIFDNISNQLLTALRATLATGTHADFCVGYFNLRGWQALDDLIADWNPAQGQICRVLIGMQRPPHEEVRELYQLRTHEHDDLIDNARASQLKLNLPNGCAADKCYEIKNRMGLNGAEVDTDD